MAELQYKKETGALHIGGGRFFYAGEPVEVKDGEKAELLSKYADLEDVTSDEKASKDNKTSDLHTEASLKKLNAEQQKAIIADMDGDLESVSNEEERISLILELQEEQEAGE